MTIYRLSEYRFYGIDPSDGERVEERRILGYFSDRSKLAEALLACRRCGIGEEETAVEEFSVPLRRGRRFLYELSYEFSLRRGENVEDFYDIFGPQKSRWQCLRLKRRLQRSHPRFRPAEGKEYTQSYDGFWIERYEIDKLYSVLERK